MTQQTHEQQKEVSRAAMPLEKAAIAAGAYALLDSVSYLQPLYTPKCMYFK